MSINNLRPGELIGERKTTSDLKNDTDDLTFEEDVSLNNAHYCAKVRNMKSQMEVDKAVNDGTVAYLESLVF